MNDHVLYLHQREQSSLRGVIFIVYGKVGRLQNECETTTPLRWVVRKSRAEQSDEGGWGIYLQGG